MRGATLLGKWLKPRPLSFASSTVEGMVVFLGFEEPGHPAMPNRVSLNNYVNLIKIEKDEKHITIVQESTSLAR